MRNIKYIILLLLIFILTSGQMTTNFKKTQDDFSGEINRKDLTSTISGLTNYGSERILAIGDSYLQYWWVNDPEDTDDQSAGVVGWAAVYFNEAIDNQADSGANVYLYKAGYLSITNQYRDHCCDYTSQTESDCTQATGDNTCTYDWVIFDGGGNDIFSEGCMEYAIDTCAENSGCVTIKDSILKDEGGGTWSGDLYDFLLDYKEQASGDKNLLIVGGWGTHPAANWGTNPSWYIAPCTEELFELYEQLSEDTALESTLGYDIYYIDVIAAGFTWEQHPEFYLLLQDASPIDNLHHNYRGGQFVGALIADVLNTYD